MNGVIHRGMNIIIGKLRFSPETINGSTADFIFSLEILANKMTAQILTCTVKIENGIKAHLTFTQRDDSM
jgi:hypothetical protein